MQQISKPLSANKENVRKTITIPSKNKGAKNRKKIWLKRIGIFIAACFALGVISVVAVFAWFSRDLPSPDKIHERFIAESTRIYDRTGTVVLYEAGKDVKRTSIKLSDVPNNVKWATIDLEDKTFYDHPGFDWRGIIRSVYINLTSDQKVGGSTLTQQFLKLTVLGKEKKYTRKIKEVILAIQMERKYSKDEILEMYLNEVGYGGINYGIAAAADSFFGKKPMDLTLAEAATLASMPQMPTTYMNNWEALTVRRNHCLDLMVKQGHITSTEAEEAKKVEVKLNKLTIYKKAPHFVDYVISKLEDDYGGSFMNEGLKVITTLDWDKQQLAEQVINDNMEAVRNYGGSNAALISIDAHTGQILAMVGSYDYYAEDYDGQVNVTTSPRQPGSSFKPVAYYTAFSKGYTPNTTIFDLTTTFPVEGGEPYVPHNYSGSTSGPMTMQRALGQSLNIPAVKTLYLAGLNNVLDIADKLGYTTLKDRSRYGLALVLGGGEVRLLEHTAAFATFAREGVQHPTASILKVEDRNNGVLYEWQNQENQILDQAAVQMLNQSLSNPSNRAGFTKLNIPGHTTAAKTGTTQDFHDGWTVGYTPSFATGVWVGNNNNTAMNEGADGSFVAAPIWNDYMSSILSGLPDETFNQPPPINTNKAVLWGAVGTTVKKMFDKYTGKMIPDECLETYPKDYMEERELKDVHTILYYLNKDDPQGDYPTNPASDPMFSAWEGPIQAWANNQEGYLHDDPEYESCDLRQDSQKPQVQILSPSSGAELNNKNFSIKVKASTGNQRQITKIVYTIDSTVVDTKTTSPFDSTYAPSNLTSGQHTLTVTVYDDKGDQISASVKFTFTSNVSKNKNTNTSSNKNKNGNNNNNKKKKD